MKPIDRYDSLFQFYAEKTCIDWRLLKAQMIVESSGDPEIVNKKSGAGGLAQFMSKTWSEWWDGTPGIQKEPPPNESRFNPEKAIRRQVDYMVYLAKNTGAEKDALAAYNWGIGNVRKLKAIVGLSWEEHLPIETKNYVEKILSLSRRL